MGKELDHVYRTHMAATRRTNALPEMIVRFCRKCIHDRVPKVSQDKQLKYPGKTIIILKDTPWKIRQLRRQYNFLTKALSEADITYKWIYPEGLIFIGKGEKSENR